MVQQIGREPVSQFLGTLPVVNPDQGVVGRGEADAFRHQLPGQPAMAVAVELQTEWRPSGNPQMDEAQPGVHDGVSLQSLAQDRNADMK